MRSGPDPSSGDLSLSHYWFNSGKRSAVLDLKSATGQRQLAELARGADIVIETGGSGLDLSAPRADRPALTVVSVRPFGLSGPRRDWLGPDLIVWALGGGMGLTGLPGRPPLHANWLIPSQVAGLYAAIGGLAGLFHARATGQGLHFDLSSQEALLSLHETLLVLALYAGQRQTRQGVENPIMAPYGTFPTADGREVMMAVVTQGQWGALTAWMVEKGGVDPWVLDPELAPMVRRGAERPRIHEALGRWTRQLTVTELVDEANRRRIPCAPINPPRDVLDDAQLLARGFFVPLDQPAIGRPVRYPSFAYQFDGVGPVRPAPDGVQGTGDRVEWLPQTGGSSSPATLNPVPSTLYPLAGLRVLDFTWALAGPTATRVLGDLGAEVIKIEPRDGGDIVRNVSPHWGGQPDPNRAGFFQRLSRNKKNLTLDLKKPAAIEVVKRLVGWADLVVDNFGAGVLERVGLGADELARIRPDLIQASLSGFGQAGPTRLYPSFAQVSQARGGLTYSTGYPDGTATGFGMSFGDTGAGLQLALVCLAAVEQRRRTGRGTRIDMSQLEAAIMFLGPALLDAEVNGRSFQPRGSLLPDRQAAPHGAYPAAGAGPVGDADRWIAIAALDEGHWQWLVEAMERPELAGDPRFATAADRVANVEALDALIGAWTRDQEAHALADRLQAAGVPAGVVQDGPDILERDPQLAARGFLARVDQPEMGPIAMDTMPLRWTDGPVPIRFPAPRVGEHNEAILQELLGLSDDEIVQLIIDEVI